MISNKIVRKLINVIVFCMHKSCDVFLVSSCLSRWSDVEDVAYHFKKKRQRFMHLDWLTFAIVLLHCTQKKNRLTECRICKICVILVRMNEEKNEATQHIRLQWYHSHTI